MKMKCMLLLIGGLAGIMAPAAARAQGSLQPMVVTNLTGNLHIQQGLPLWCDDVVKTTPVTQALLRITPAEGFDVPGGKSFVLTGANVSFAPFAISGSCAGYSETRDYSIVGVQVVRAVRFTAVPSVPDVYHVTIPKADFLIYQASIVNGALETGYKRPRQDVTGTINLANGTIQFVVVVATKIHFEAGCVPGLGCVFDEDKAGTVTASLSGSIVFPDSDGDGVPDRLDNCPLVANREQDKVPPIIRVPSAVTVATCVAPRIGPVLGWDICRDLPATVTDDAPDPFRPGTNAITWTAEDAQGHVSSTRQTVTVVDSTPPVFTSLPMDLTRNDCGPAPLGLPTAEDDCGGTPALTNDARATFPAGATEVTWTAADGRGNQATATQTVTVDDAVAPAASCLPAGRDADTFQVFATDSCTESPTIRLGKFVLANGETIVIHRVVRPGVRLFDRGGLSTKYFLVGPDDAVITATDAAGNVGRAACPVR